MKRLVLMLGVAGCVTPPAPVPLSTAPAPVVVAPVAEPVDAGPVDAGLPALTADEVKQVLELNCRSCHSLAYVDQQRMSAGQWTATLTKMRGWGALLEEPQVGQLATALASTRGPTALLPVFETREVAPFVVEAEKPIPAGAAKRGQVTFMTRCLPCHGPDAHGGIGVNLVDRPLLQQPTYFAGFVNAGRGRMPPHADLGPVQLTELLAWLRTQ